MNCCILICCPHLSESWCLLVKELTTKHIKAQINSKPTRLKGWVVWRINSCSKVYGVLGLSTNFCQWSSVLIPGCMYTLCSAFCTERWACLARLWNELWNSYTVFQLRPLTWLIRKFSVEIGQLYLVCLRKPLCCLWCHVQVFHVRFNALCYRWSCPAFLLFGVFFL